MVSPSLDYITGGLEGGTGYSGEIFQFDVRVGTTSRLRSIGVTNVPDSGLPMVNGVRWRSTNAFFKYERPVMNIGLGNGRALDIFNDNLLNVTQIR